MRVAGFSWKQIGEKLHLTRQRARQLCQPLAHERLGRNTCEQCHIPSRVLRIRYKDCENQDFLILCPSCDGMIAKAIKVPVPTPAIDTSNLPS